MAGTHMSPSIAKIAPALLKAQKEMGDAKKDTKNPFFKSSYADLNSVREAVTPALHANGISVLQLNTHVESAHNTGTSVMIPVVRTMLLHDSGEYIYSDTEIVVKDKNDAQKYGSSLSYARRYGLSSLLSVGAVDDDGTLATSEGKSKATTGSVKVTNTGASVSATPTANGSGFGSFRKPAAT